MGGSACGSGPMVSETGRGRRKEREETSHHRDGAEASRLAASFVGERRSVRTVAQQPAKSVGDSSIRTKNISGKGKSKAKTPSSGAGVIAWPKFYSGEPDCKSVNKVQEPADRTRPTWTQ